MGRTGRRQRALITLLCAWGGFFPKAGGAMFQWLAGLSDAENAAIRYSITAPSDASTGGTATTFSTSGVPAGTYFVITVR